MCASRIWPIHTNCEPGHPNKQRNQEPVLASWVHSLTAAQSCKVVPVSPLLCYCDATALTERSSYMSVWRPDVSKNVSVDMLCIWPVIQRLHICMSYYMYIWHKTVMYKVRGNWAEPSLCNCSQHFSLPMLCSSVEPQRINSFIISS